MMFDEELMVRLAVALGVGLLLGIERGWRGRELADGGRVAGIRTFSISGLAGGIAGALGSDASGAITLGGGIVLAASLACHTAAIAVFDRARGRAAGDFSATSTVAALLTFLLGALAGAGHLRAAAAAAVIATAILTGRSELHSLLRRVTLEEIRSALTLLAMTVVALPWIPDRQLDALGGLNPRDIWVLAIALALISFIAHVAVKELGERRGLLAAAAVGGLVSSTAVLLASARRAARREDPVVLLLAGAALATSLSLGRVVALTAALAPALLGGIVPPLLAAGLVSLAFAGWAARSHHGGVGPLQAPAKSPFRLLPICGMAVVIGVLVIIGDRLHARYGGGATLAGATLMGAFDVDAMTISMARLVTRMPDRALAVAILAGVAGNTVVKILLAAVFGPRSFALGYLALGGVCLLTGGATLFLLMT